MYLMLNEHRQYLSDRIRLSSFRRAINAVIKPGDVVLDLACGTGVLGLLAMKAGAAKVYQVDHSPMIQIARDVADANGYAQSTIGIHQSSNRTSLPEKADLLIADQLSHFGVGAGIPEMFNDARRRLLKPGARAIPRRLELFVAPVNFPDLWRRVSFWDQRHAGLDMSPVHGVAFNTVHLSDKSPRRKLGNAARIFAFDLTELAPERFSAKAEIEDPGGGHHARSHWMVCRRARRRRIHDQFAIQQKPDSEVFGLSSSRKAFAAKQGRPPGNLADSYHYAKASYLEDNSLRYKR